MGKKTTMLMPRLAPKTISPNYLVHLDLRQRVMISLYIAIIVGGTIIQHMSDVPPSPFSDKRNPLNTVFVKLGWVGFS